ncbi:MAG: ComF family protein [Candidatus Zambryskibacteria bacterium]|nr:ComF family protein [Candidatus Zambryskibacteria bacterium]
MSLISYIKNLANNLTDFLYPKSAKVLELESLSTDKLWELLPKSVTLEGGDIIAIFDYSHSLVKEIIWEVKYNGNRVLADKLGEILYDIIVDELEERNVFEKTSTVTLMPIPISDKRRFERGWNQSELIADAVKVRDNAGRFKYLPRQLAKLRHTESQTKTANKSERKENLRNSMKVLNPLSVQDKYVVLIDDVVTTCSTFAEARRALKVAGAKRVMCFAIAH